MKILKRTISALLALALAAGMLPVSALAAEATAATESAETATDTTVPEETWEIGEVTVEETAVAAGTSGTSGTCGTNLTWSFDEGTGTLTISGTGAMNNFYYMDDWVPDNCPWLHLKDLITTAVIESGVTTIGEDAFGGCRYLTEVYLPVTVTKVCSDAFNQYFCATAGSGLKVYYEGSEEQWNAIDIWSKYSSLLAGCEKSYNTVYGAVAPEETEPEVADVVTEYLNSSTIKINGSGSAFAYYLGEANQDYQVVVNGEAQTVQANEKGVLRVALGTFETAGTETVTVEFTHVGGEMLPEPQTFQTTVQVTPLEFSQSWKGSLDASVGAKMSLGAKVPGVDLEASLGSVGAKVGTGAAMNIYRSYSSGREALMITSDKKIEAGATVKCGVTGNVLKAKLESNLTLGVGGSDTVTYGLMLNNYSANNKGQQRAIGTYLLGEMLAINPVSVLYYPFYKHLAEIVYDDNGCAVVHGSASKINGTLGLSKITINGKEIVPDLKGSVDASVIQSEKTISDGTREKSVSAKLNTNISAVLPAKMVEGSEIGDNAALLKADFLGTDIKITAEKYRDVRKLESTSLSAASTQFKFLEIGVPTTAVYNKYIFEDAALDGLLSSTSGFDGYLNGDEYALSFYDLAELADVLSTSDVPIQYKQETKTKYTISLPLEFDLGLGTGTTLGVTLSYLEDNSHTSATGYAVDDAIMLTSQSDDLSHQIKENGRELEEIFINCMNVLAEDAANFFKSVGDAIQEGVENTWSWIEGKADSAANWFISITCAPSESDGPWKESSQIGVKGTQVNFAMARQVTNPSEAYVTKTAMTVGRPFVVNVTDADNGETIGSFEEEPLEFTIRYAAEDVQTAGFTSAENIAMYRYSDDGDYFEFVGGLHDADAMTVTAVITQPGQYILAVEEVEEEVGCGYAYGDANHDGKINAKDATLVLQYAVGTIREGQTFCQRCADVTGEGGFNAKDATLILRKSSGLLDKFPVEN